MKRLRFSKKAYLAGLFVLSFAVFGGVMFYFQVYKKNHVVNADFVHIGNSGFVVTSDNPDSVKKKRILDDGYDENLGNKDDPFFVLEIVPSKELAEIGYLIAGCEPVDVDKIRDTNMGTELTAVSSLGGGIAQQSAITRWMPEGDTSLDAIVDSSGNKVYDATGNTKKVKGYLEKATDGQGDYTIKGVENYYEKFADNIYSTKEAVLVKVAFRLATAADTKLVRYSVATEKQIVNTWGTERDVLGYYKKDANGKYVYQDQVDRDDSMNGGYIVSFKEDPAGEYVVSNDATTYLPRYGSFGWLDGESTVGFQECFNLYKKVTRTKDEIDLDGEIAITKTNKGEGDYKWVEVTDAEYTDHKDGVTLAQFLEEGNTGKFYTEVTYAEYRSKAWQYDYQNKNLFLINCLGLGIEHDYAGNGNNLDYTNNAGLVKEIENYHICVKTITPAELNAKPEWLDKADFISIGYTTHVGTQVDMYLKYNKEGITEPGKNIVGSGSGSKGTFTPENNTDLSWEVVKKIWRKVVTDKEGTGAGMVLDKSMWEANAATVFPSLFGKGKIKDDCVQDIITRQYSLKNKALTKYYHTSNATTPGTRNGYLNNTYKLLIMLLCMDMDVFDTYYAKGFEEGSLIQDVEVKVGDKTMTTGSFVAQVDDNYGLPSKMVTQKQKNAYNSQVYWDSMTFFMCLNDNTGANKNGDRSDWATPNGTLFKAYGTNYNINEGFVRVTGRVFTFNGDTSLSQGFLGNYNPSYSDSFDDYMDGAKDRGQFTPADAAEYVINYPVIYKLSLSHLNVLDIEPYDWYTHDEEARDTHEQEICDLFRKSETNESGSEVESFDVNMDVTYHTPQSFSGSNEPLENYDLIIIGNKTADLADNVEGDSYLYSHTGKANGETSYPGNDLTLAAAKKLKAYMDAGHAVVYWDDCKLNESKNRYESTSSFVDTSGTEYRIFDDVFHKPEGKNTQIDINSYMGRLLTDSKLEQLTAANKATADGDYPKNADRKDDMGIFNFEAACKAYAKLDDSDEKKDYKIKNPNVWLRSDILTMIRVITEGSKKKKLTIGQDGKADQEELEKLQATRAEVVRTNRFYKQCMETVDGSRLDLSFSEKPLAYTGQDEKISKDNDTKFESYNDSFITNVADELNFTFKLQNMDAKSKYSVKGYIDVNADGTYSDDEVFWYTDSFEIEKDGNDQSKWKYKVGGKTLDALAYTYDNVSGYTVDGKKGSTNTQLTQSNTVKEEHRDYLYDHIGAISWKFVVTDETKKLTTEESGVSAIAPPNIDKKVLRILQIVPDTDSEITFNMQEENDGGWLYDYTKDLKEYYLAIFTMKVSEFEALYDIKTSNYSNVVTVATDSGDVRYYMKDNNRLTYDVNNEKTNRLSKIDLLVLGFAKDGLDCINNDYGALDNVIDFINENNSVIFSNTINTVNETSDKGINIPAVISDEQRVTDKKQKQEEQQEAGAAGAAISAGSASEALQIAKSGAKATPKQAEKKAEASPAEPTAKPDEPAAIAASPTDITPLPRTVYPKGYIWNKYFRGTMGNDRFGVSLADSSIVKDVKTQDVNFFHGTATQGYTYGTVMTKGAGVPFNSMGTKTTANELTITNRNSQIMCYPYKINHDIDYSVLIEGEETTTFSTVGAKAQMYQLNLEDMMASDSADSNITVWCTLEGEDTIYNKSGKDASNNYYLYTKGNVVYTGIGCASLSGSDDTLDMERKLFVNTIIAAFNKAKDIAIDVPDAVEASNNEFCYYLDYDDMAEIDNLKDDDFEYIAFNVTDSRSINFATTLEYIDGTEGSGNSAIEIYEFKDGVYGQDANGKDISYAQAYEDGKFKIKPGNWSTYLKKKDKTTSSDMYDGTYKLLNGSMYFIRYQKKLVKDSNKNKIVIAAKNDRGEHIESNLNIMCRGYFNLD